MKRPAIVALMGPTASGKTAASLDLAEQFGGEIVSVDSALVYRGLDIGSAKPTLEERRGIPHHLIDVRAPHEPYSAAEFAVDARAAVEGILERAALPILVGGTGLYFRALLEGLSAMPAADAALRQAVTDEGAQRGWPAMHAELARVDARAAARIKPTDPQRIVRAIEVFRLSGRPISVWQEEGAQTGGSPWRVLRVVLCPPDRAELHRRIGRRFELMLDQGLIGEVEQLRRDPRLHADLPAVRAVGYRQTWAYLQGECDRAALGEQVTAATRQLAKRQITWLRREWAAFWRDPGGAPAAVHELVTRFLG
ncbi:MAG: tRNA (adenosine(37)-N6)-dimethylallyltransferase MiaA [Xanthomonadales bacterium]|nr:tRNA (adenosine(37)-N6)-dimethylallyltransferase MiaA [Xanthomonadales bacterium]